MIVAALVALGTAAILAWLAAPHVGERADAARIVAVRRHTVVLEFDDGQRRAWPRPWLRRRGLRSWKTTRG